MPIKDAPNFKCICQAGYELDTSLRGCVSANRPQYLIFGQQKPGIIRGIPIDTQIISEEDIDQSQFKTSSDYTEKEEDDVEVIVPVVDLSRPTAMDVHAGIEGAHTHLYIADSQRLTIERQGIM